MIDCVSIENCFSFDTNLITAQHKLRYKEVVEKENWSNIYVMNDMEFDRYDNVATEYLIARDKQNRVVGVTRTYPTTIPYMLSEVFTHLFSKELPSNPRIMEASRLVLDRSILTKEQRKPIIDQLIVGFMERGLQRNIDAYVGFMIPKIWGSTFLRAGWDVKWLGPEIFLPQAGYAVRAGMMVVNEKTNRIVRQATGITEDILNFGSANCSYNPGMATFSHELIAAEKKQVA